MYYDGERELRLAVSSCGRLAMSGKRDSAGPRRANCVGQGLAWVEVVRISVYVQ